MSRPPWIGSALAVLGLCCLAAAGPGALADETDAPPNRSGQWALDGGAALTLAPGGALRLDDRLLADGVLGEPAIDAAGQRILVARLADDDRASELLLWRLDGGEWRASALAPNHQSPDRPAISPDGQQIAFVSGLSGLAAIWWVGCEGCAPRQLTNVDLPPAAGGPPAGWVPVPHRGPPRFDGGQLRWAAPDGDHEIALPEPAP